MGLKVPSDILAFTKSLVFFSSGTVIDSFDTSLKSIFEYIIDSFIAQAIQILFFRRIFPRSFWSFLLVNGILYKGNGV
jgi:hypothetical protein